MSRSRRRPWRLRVDGPGGGAWNMGVDEALLASASAGGRPTLRFYTWDGPWLSLGYAQPDDPVRTAACRAARVGVVRRPTGGRAVLHGQDLTYALAAPLSALPSGLQPGLHACYAAVGEALGRALRSLGVEAEARPAQGSARGAGEFDCFAAPAAHELCVAGRKLVGSAQRRTRGGVLQHGSIRLAPDPEPARRAAGLRSGAATSLREEGFEGPLGVLIEACRRELARVLEAEFEPARVADPRSDLPDPHSRGRLDGR